MGRKIRYKSGEYIRTKNGQVMFRLKNPAKVKNSYYIVDAYDELNKRDCFLKFTEIESGDDPWGKRIYNLRREGQFQFYYPYIEHVYDTFSGIDPEGDPVFGVNVELVSGENLYEYRIRLQKEIYNGLISEENAEYIIFRQILQFLYAMNYYLQYATPSYFHRDIKPQNIMITENKDIKIIDFDYAHICDSTSTQDVNDQSSDLGFTLGYTAPSVLKNGCGQLPGEKEEIYAAGKTIFYWLNGREYFHETELIGSKSPLTIAYCVDERLGYGFDTERFEKKYLDDRYADLLAINRRMCCAPDSEECYQSVAQILCDMKKFLLTYCGNSFECFETRLQIDKMPLFQERMNRNEDKAPMVVHKVEGKSKEGGPLVEYTMRDISVDGKIIMTVYNIRDEIYYIPAIGTELVLENRDESEYRIQDKDIFSNGKIKIQFTIR